MHDNDFTPLQKQQPVTVEPQQTLTPAHRIGPRPKRGKLTKEHVFRHWKPGFTLRQILEQYEARGYDVGDVWQAAKDKGYDFDSPRKGPEKGNNGNTTNTKRKNSNSTFQRCAFSQ